MVLGFACGCAATPLDGAAARDCPRLAPAPLALGVGARSDAPTLAALRVEASVDRLSDPARLFFAQVQAPPPGFRGVPDAGPFPRESADVRAYAVGHGSAYHLGTTATSSQ